MRNSPLATGLSVIGLTFAISACVPATHTYEQLDHRSQFVQTSSGGQHMMPFGQPHQTSYQQPRGYQQQMSYQQPTRYQQPSPCGCGTFFGPAQSYQQQTFGYPSTGFQGGFYRR